MREQRTDANITKKWNSICTVEYRTTMSIIEKLSNTFTKQLKTEHIYTLLNETINIRECL